MKNKFKGLITLITAVILCISTVGCNKGSPDDSDSSKEVPMGRYVEEEIEMPDDYTDNLLLGMRINNDGNLELYSQSGNNYTLIDGVWTKEEQRWMVNNDMLMPSVLTYGEDGTPYLLFHDWDFIAGIMKKTEQNTFEIINLEGHDVKNSESNVYPYPSDMKILKNGNIVVSYLGKEYCTLFDGKTGKKINDIETGMLTTDLFAVTTDTFENSIVSLSTDIKNVVITNTENINDKKEIPLDSLAATLTHLFVDKDGTTYISNSEGLSQLPLGSTMWETIIDGRDTSFGLTDLNLSDFIKGNNNDYYGVFETAKAPCKIMHYVYDENAKIEADTEISIYSLIESNFIRQAVTKFNIENKNIKLNYRVGMNNDSLTISDCIKALNTEILAGKGSDILILDGLNTDAYIEKGILKDISSIMTPKVESGELLENIANDYIVDDKCYIMPSRFFPSIVYGKNEAVEASKDLAKLVQYYNENSDKDIMIGRGSCEELTYMFMINNYDYGFDIKNKRFDTEKFAEFLNNIKVVFDNINRRETDNTFVTKYSKEIDDLVIFNKYIPPFWHEAWSPGIYYGATDFQYYQPLYFEDTYSMIGAVKRIEGKYADVNNSYSPKNIVGVNSKTENTEAAEKFLDLLFSENIQKTDADTDGFSVNEKVIDSKVKFDSTYNGGITMDDDDGNMYNQNVVCPGEALQQQLVDFLKTLENPYQPDYIVSDIIFKELVPFFKDEATAEEIADNVASKIELYFMEQ